MNFIYTLKQSYTSHTYTLQVKLILTILQPCKLIFDKKTDLLLGAHLIGDNVSEIIAELVVAKKAEMKGHDIIKSIHPHPSMSEAVMEAAAAAYDEVIHL